MILPIAGGQASSATFKMYIIAMMPMSSATLEKLQPLYRDPGFVQKLEKTLEKGSIDKLSPDETNALLETVILDSASEKGIDITQAEIRQFSSDSLDDELAAASGGTKNDAATAACSAGGGVQGIICTVGAAFTAGASAIASLVTVGGTAIGSATANL